MTDKVYCLENLDKAIKGLRDGGNPAMIRAYLGLAASWLRGIREAEEVER